MLGKKTNSRNANRSANVGLVWFQHDLRLHDQWALARAASEHTELVYLYCFDPVSKRSGPYQSKACGRHREGFIRESLADLHRSLQQHGAALTVRHQSPQLAIVELVAQHNIQHVYFTHSGATDERRRLNNLQEHLPHVQFHGEEGFTLFRQAQLPFALQDLPETFSAFRREIEKLDLLESGIDAPQAAPSVLPPSPLPNISVSITEPANDAHARFTGGEQTGLNHLRRYFESGAASVYKQTRNALDGWQDSTKFSPWLALGNLSPREVVARLKRYEAQYGANESTYWIQFELLWREYFQWYARKHDSGLFRFRGIKRKAPQTSFYPERFKKWCQGTTPYPIVNACMRQLNTTGYMSNRGRQLVASCLVHELQLDWRYGAAYFEQQLIDYDVASNWGNWQYLAGVGADPRGHRHFDLQKQQAMYDPEGEFIKRWTGDPEDNPPPDLDSLDAAGWPLGYS